MKEENGISSKRINTIDIKGNVSRQEKKRKHFEQKRSLEENKKYQDQIEYRRDKSKEEIIEQWYHLLPQKELDHMEQMRLFREYMVRKGYSGNTIKCYYNLINLYMRRSFFDLNIRNFNMYIFQQMNLGKSHTHCNQMINAVKLFAKFVDHPECSSFKYYERPKVEKKLPKVLSKNEIRRIIGASENIKHKTQLMIGYSCGLRVNEVSRLRLTDIDAERMVVTVEQSKGRKDRVTTLSQVMLSQLRDYYVVYHPHYWLFEGQQNGNPITTRTLQRIFNDAASKAGIRKKVTFHSLRHSFATHLLESGVDIRYIQELLGHANSKTTERYTHVSTRSIQNITNPLDTL